MSSIFRLNSLNASNQSVVTTTSRRSRASKLTHRKSADSWRIDPPSHRHAAPSAPWPWVDISDAVDADQLDTKEKPIPDKCEHEGSNCSCWRNYPSSRFPNWTPEQVRKAGITAAIDGDDHTGICTIYRCDVDTDGLFKDPGSRTTEGQTEDDMWKEMLRENGDGLPGNLRVRALFVDNMSGPVLQMLGARFNIEPFFFSSSLKWIPSRFQEEIVKGVGDHITVTVPFIKSIDIREAHRRKHGDLLGADESQDTLALTTKRIDTQEPLNLNSVKKSLVLDLLSFHLVRNIKGSTLISFHPSTGPMPTKAHHLQIRARFAGQSVYWQSMFQRSPDPTLVLVCFIWHAIYAWDEALESLYQHILSLESRVIETSSTQMTNELHSIRANHLHYSALLDEFTKNVDFICESENPFMTYANFKSTPHVIEENKVLIARECKNLNQNVQRLKNELHQQERRLKNVMNLVFSSVSIKDSQHMRQMTEAAVRDSAAMKQIAYLTMVFLPASFVATAFGMNVNEINPGSGTKISIYVAVALPLTVFTAWIIIAFQSRYIFKEFEAPSPDEDGQVPLGTDGRPKKITFIFRLAWPVVVVWQRFFKRQKKPSNESDLELEERGQQTTSGSSGIDIKVESPNQPDGTAFLGLNMAQPRYR